MGLVAMVMLALIATHYLETSPLISPLVNLRTLCEQTPGLPQRLVDLTWAPDPKPGQPGHGLRAVFRPVHGPKAPTRMQQADELARFILRGWAPAKSVPKLGFVEIRAITGSNAWTRIEPHDYLPGAVAPEKDSGYPPRDR
jgi:hypothetical protein